MVTPREQRRIRLKNDFKEMCNIRCNEISWVGTVGNSPYFESYEINVKIRTLIGPEPTYRSQHLLKLSLPSDYPRACPEIHMLTRPQPYHPNWYTSGKWCHGSWVISEGLGHFVLRMIRTLQYDLEITNPDSPANSEANRWFLQNRGTRGLFPCDKTSLPDPTTSGLMELNPDQKKFSIHQAPPKKGFRIISDFTDNQ